MHPSQLPVIFVNKTEPPSTCLYKLECFLISLACVLEVPRILPVDNLRKGPGLERSTLSDVFVSIIYALYATKFTGTTVAQYETASVRGLLGLKERRDAGPRVYD
jgi:hypothetical protein